MSPSEAHQRIAALRTELARHDELYYRQAQPELADFDYDRLKRELADLEHGYPDLARGDSPTQRVGGAPIPGFVTVHHAVPMMSIDNTYAVDEVRVVGSAGGAFQRVHGGHPGLPHGAQHLDEAVAHLVLHDGASPVVMIIHVRIFKPVLNIHDKSECHLFLVQIHWG